MMRRIPAFALMLAMLASCTDRANEAPITMSVIGEPLMLADPLRQSTAVGGEIVLAATAQGLVSFDAEGRIEPALAERWIVTDDGLSYIFRIRRSKWNDGRDLTARQVAERLRAMMAPNGRHPMRPLFGGVTQVIAMTGHVLEVRLRAPQPDFLQLLAQPDMALVRGKVTLGSGPYRIHSVRNGVTRLRPIPREMVVETDPPDERRDIRLRGEAASLAVARFQAREISLVTGGTYANLALARAALPAAAQFQVDPVYGLFGLAVSARSEVLKDGGVRRALAMSIDRERIVRSFGVNSWKAQLSVLPGRLDSSADPAALEWVQLPIEERIARARGLIGDRAPLTVRVALPPGPGSRLLLSALAADWRKIGVSIRAVGLDAEADLRLIDEVAPQSAAYWYLDRLSCARGLACDPNTETALSAINAATTIAERGDAVAETDAKIAERQVFIPIALPLRWSLVSPNLVGWRGNAFAVHTLQHLR